MLQKDTIEPKKNVTPEMIKAAYALNMCTVSVSQIVDYKDTYILEQEYNAILNNLNLENIPKDEALLNTLREILNTITFFRIQEIKRREIDKEYNQRIKNAVWSAIPNMTMIVASAANPISLPLALFSIATTVGSSYMSYRKEKSLALLDRDKNEVELQITAIEQLNALRRELFTTAWRLADTYKFPDAYRLTERQIEQYNAILMDSDEYRKYARLDYIKDNFEAYPPFWYFLGHTAHYIAVELNRDMPNDSQREKNEKSYIRKQYLNKAKTHLEHFAKLTENSILRNDQLAASGLLEYCDLLLTESAPDYEQVKKNITMAEAKSGNELDLLQLCAIEFLKIGAIDDAARLFKMLVNENYNSSMNARLLSKLYVNSYVVDKNMEAYSEYGILRKRIDEDSLFPMPDGVLIEDKNVQMQQLNDQFIIKLKENTKRKYKIVLSEYMQLNTLKFINVFPRPTKGFNESYPEYEESLMEDVFRDADSLGKSISQWESYVAYIQTIGFANDYLAILNETLSAMDEISKIEDYNKALIALDDREEAYRDVEAMIFRSKKSLTEYQDKMYNGSFSADDFKELISKYSYRYYTDGFFDELEKLILQKIDLISNMEELEELEYDLFDFCVKYKLSYPDEDMNQSKIEIKPNRKNTYFQESILGKKAEQEQLRREDKDNKIQIIKKRIDQVVINHDNFGVYFAGEKEFNVYFDNIKLDGNVIGTKSGALVVFDDKSKKDDDLILMADGFVLVRHNKIKEKNSYSTAKYAAVGKGKIKYGDLMSSYSNPNLNIMQLSDLFTSLA